MNFALFVGGGLLMLAGVATKSKMAYVAGLASYVGGVYLEFWL